MLIFICHVLDYSYVIPETSPSYIPLLWVELSAKIVGTSLDLGIALIFVGILRFYLRNKEKHSTPTVIYIHVANIKKSRNCFGDSTSNREKCKVAMIIFLVIVNFMEGLFTLSQPVIALTLGSNTPGGIGDLISNYYISILRVQCMMIGGLGFLYLAYQMGM